VRLGGRLFLIASRQCPKEFWCSMSPVSGELFSLAFFDRWVELPIGAEAYPHTHTHTHSSDIIKHGSMPGSKLIEISPYYKRPVVFLYTIHYHLSFKLPVYACRPKTWLGHIWVKWSPTTARIYFRIYIFPVLYSWLHSMYSSSDL
jgi:hypothetical protein